MTPIKPIRTPKAPPPRGGAGGAIYLCYSLRSSYEPASREGGPLSYSTLFSKLPLAKLEDLPTFSFSQSFVVLHSYPWASIEEGSRSYPPSFYSFPPSPSFPSASLSQIFLVTDWYPNPLALYFPTQVHDLDTYLQLLS